jgi:hypothetical protein
MRKILIDKDVEAIASEYKTMLDGYKDSILDSLKNLRDMFDVTKGHTIVKKNGRSLNSVEMASCYKYVEKVWTDYNSDRLTLMLPNKFEEVYKNEYLVLLRDKELRLGISIDADDYNSISNRLIDLMGYSGLVRKVIYPKLMRKLGIKSCVYCNANYAVATEDGDGFFELDHWKPESKYPFLSTSFYNLQPCCPHCNKRKGSNNKLEFLKLFEEDPNEPLDVFEFHIPESSMVRYFNSQNTSHIKVTFKSANTKFDGLRNDTNEKFGIEGIYNEHIDVVEEMMWRAKFYDNVILGTMTWIFKKRWPMIDIARFKLGSYATEKEVHKRPLTKFMQDIGKQLEIN